MNSYISIKSYVKCGEDYIDFFDFTGPVKDPDYIDGALELSVNGVNLIDKSMYDYIDDLWSYLAEGLSIVSKGQTFKTYFPDQPIEVNLVPVKNIILVSVNCHSEVKVSVNKDDFLIAMAEHAKKFFEHLKLILPSSDKSSDLSISYLNDVLMRHH
ncbi:hypothetical protein [Cronobacter sakazakii]|uniref:hypothetical protein n=1 Tax=Cronobacter sakazakii TaxID=28141 RepID=UPI0010544EDA|nr:hypothetical protein [Cronobacter sakazakii]AXW98434.2 hypothetical protein CsakCS931_30660 [Cronobacter sakazakii]EIZ9238243.1 hypothetical protein [Cronobacter sakazakii]ELY4184556.1 hypothetical protein [Cronobacter sakazakii]ELY4315687.1 hypothetical protein [Cronobacter sakazakii]ELY4529331.1 hypothetical protein [Cronobacter sakazakii]